MNTVEMMRLKSKETIREVGWEFCRDPEDENEKSYFWAKRKVVFTYTHTHTYTLVFRYGWSRYELQLWTDWMIVAGNSMLLLYYEMCGCESNFVAISNNKMR